MIPNDAIMFVLLNLMAMSWVCASKQASKKDGTSAVAFASLAIVFSILIVYELSAWIEGAACVQ